MNIEKCNKQEIIKMEFEKIMKTIRNTQEKNILLECKYYLEPETIWLLNDIKSLFEGKDYDVNIIGNDCLDISWYRD